MPGLGLGGPRRGARNRDGGPGAVQRLGRAEVNGVVRPLGGDTKRRRFTKHQFVPSTEMPLCFTVEINVKSFSFPGGDRVLQR